MRTEQQRRDRIVTTETPQRRSSGESASPEFEPADRGNDLSETIEEMGKGIVNTFTVERDTSLADGAGAPGSTAVGGLRDEDDR
jgi:hypothetical protein